MKKFLIILLGVILSIVMFFTYLFGEGKRTYNEIQYDLSNKSDINEICGSRLNFSYYWHATGLLRTKTIDFDIITEKCKIRVFCNVTAMRKGVKTYYTIYNLN